MFESVSRSFALIKESWKVLSLDKEILLFPVLSGVALLFILLSFVIPVLFLGYFSGSGPGLLGRSPHPGSLPLLPALLLRRDLFQYRTYYVRKDSADRGKPGFYGWYPERKRTYCTHIHLGNDLGDSRACPPI